MHLPSEAATTATVTATEAAATASSVATAESTTASVTATEAAAATAALEAATTGRFGLEPLLVERLAVLGNHRLLHEEVLGSELIRVGVELWKGVSDEL